MRLFYDLGIYLYGTALCLLQPFHKKAKKFVSGRKNVFRELEGFASKTFEKRIWVHAASVGEFEQSRVLIERIKSEYPNYGILLSFFSPSGYELRKNYPFADQVVYLPLDKEKNARKFIDLVQPGLTIFTKYEFWNYYLTELNHKGVPVLSISTIFREKQTYFKNPEGFYAQILKNISFFFVQNELSGSLLESIGLKNYVINGDSRFDRVGQIARSVIEIPEAEAFIGNKPVMVCGSVWKEDMEVLIPLIQKYAGQVKFIIAPHEIHDQEIEHYRGVMKVNSQRFSGFDQSKAEETNVLWIDNIGMLSSLYKYGTYAFVGGAFGKGLHNILEAATFGLPIFFGNKRYKKFQEANELIETKGAFAVSDAEQFDELFASLFRDEALLKERSQANKDYVSSRLGASDRIFEYCKENYFGES